MTLPSVTVDRRHGRAMKRKKMQIPLGLLFKK